MNNNQLIEHKYIHLISSRLQKFHPVNRNSYSFRCNFCGDSSKSKNKTRGYFYLKDNKWNFKCFNCSESKSFKNFLKDLDPSLYKEFLLECLQESKSDTWTKKKVQDSYQPKQFQQKKKNIFKDLDVISSLSENHPAYQFLYNRKIPQEYLDQLYYCPDFKNFVENATQEEYKSLKENDSRIIIPFKNENGNIIGFQGRSLIQKSILRYITIKLDPSYPKIFGLDRVNFKEPYYICEGPFDSLFIPNAIAVAGSDFFSKDLNKQNAIIVVDNEPRKIQTVKKMKKAIDLGYKITIWPENIKEKDINELIISGYEKDQIKEILDRNSYSGLLAEIHFANWKKI